MHVRPLLSHGPLEFSSALGDKLHAQIVQGPCFSLLFGSDGQMPSYAVPVGWTPRKRLRVYQKFSSYVLAVAVSKVLEMGSGVCWWPVLLFSILKDALILNIYDVFTLEGGRHVDLLVATVSIIWIPKKMPLNIKQNWGVYCYWSQHTQLTLAASTEGAQSNLFWDVHGQCSTTMCCQLVAVGTDVM